MPAARHYLVGIFNNGIDIGCVLVVRRFFGGEKRDAQPDTSHDQNDNNSLCFHIQINVAARMGFGKSAYLLVSAACAAANAAAWSAWSFASIAFKVESKISTWSSARSLLT